MRLHLSCYRLDDRAGAPCALPGGRTRVAVSSGSLDTVQPCRPRSFREEVFDLRLEHAVLAIPLEDIDLRDFFGHNGASGKELADYAPVWMRGGNAIVLGRAMQQSGFCTLISRMLDRDEFVSGGLSKGLVAAGPWLNGFEIMNDLDGLPDGYCDDPVRDGLILIDFAIIPHYRSVHREAATAKRSAGCRSTGPLPHRIVRDGEAIVWTGARADAAAELRRIA